MLVISTEIESRDKIVRDYVEEHIGQINMDTCLTAYNKHYTQWDNHSIPSECTCRTKTTPMSDRLIDRSVSRQYRGVRVVHDYGDLRYNTDAEPFAEIQINPTKFERLD